MPLSENMQFYVNKNTINEKEAREIEQGLREPLYLPYRNRILNNREFLGLIVEGHTTLEKVFQLDDNLFDCISRCPKICKLVIGGIITFEEISSTYERLRTEGNLGKLKKLTDGVINWILDSVITFQDALEINEKLSNPLSKNKLENSHISLDEQYDFELPPYIQPYIDNQLITEVEANPLDYDQIARLNYEQSRRLVIEEKIMGVEEIFQLTNKQFERIIMNNELYEALLNRKIQVNALFQYDNLHNRWPLSSDSSINEGLFALDNHDLSDELENHSKVLDEYLNKNPFNIDGNLEEHSFSGSVLNVSLFKANEKEPNVSKSELLNTKCVNQP